MLTAEFPPAILNKQEGSRQHAQKGRKYTHHPPSPPRNLRALNYTHTGLQHVDVREWVPWFDRHYKKLPNPDEFGTCLLFCLAISFEHVV